LNQQPADATWKVEWKWSNVQQTTFVRRNSLLSIKEQKKLLGDSLPKFEIISIVLDFWVVAGCATKLFDTGFALNFENIKSTDSLPSFEETLNYQPSQNIKTTFNQKNHPS